MFNLFYKKSTSFNVLETRKETIQKNTRRKSQDIPTKVRLHSVKKLQTTIGNMTVKKFQNTIENTTRHSWLEILKILRTMKKIKDTK